MTTSVVSAITAVFTAIIQWIVSAITDVIPLFYAAETGLTFIGVLALCALGISITLLVINLVKDFLTFR